MSDSLASRNGKLNVLNKKISEIKKKIQLSEGQRKANFEECDAKKKENADRIGRLKKEVKEMQIEFVKANSTAEATERVVAPALGREASAARKRNLQDAAATLDEDNIRLQKKLDLIKYQGDKQQKQLSLLLQKYEELMNGKPKKIGKVKLPSRRLKKQIIKLENQLHRVSVMQMEADTVRKKYRSVRSSLKSDASLYASCLDELEDSIREQENEIKRLQKVKVEALELRNATRETLTKQEIEATEMSKERETVIQEFRKKVEERKADLERIERTMFSTTSRNQRDDATIVVETSDRTNDEENVDENCYAPSKNEIDKLEETFVELRNATGVSRTEEVLDRFLAQKATREKLKKLQAVTEEEKMRLEKQRQQLSAEIEMQKFSETKDADKNAEKLERLNNQIVKQKQREDEALKKSEELQNLRRNIGLKLFAFYCRFHSSDIDEETGEIIITDETTEIPDPMTLLEELNNNVNEFIENIGGREKYNELLDQMLNDKMEVLSLETSSEHTKQQSSIDDRPLFSLFPIMTTPAGPIQPSEDEDDIPTRSMIKRQAQLLVDTKSRRKGFAFKR